MPELVIPEQFKKVMGKKPPELQAAILECVTRLGENPAHPGLHAHRVKGTRGVWECYVDRANRVTYEWGDGDEIHVRNNCNHDIIERSP